MGAPETPDAGRRRPPLRRLGVVLGVWAVAAGGALALAVALDSPVGAGARDAAQPQAPAVVADPSADPPEGLPPLALVLDRSLPAGVAALPPIRQVERLRALAERSGDARRHVELGSVLQILGDRAGAGAAYRTALRLGGDDVAAETGLALLQGASGAEGQRRAARRLSALAAAHPDNQVVAFNQGWLEIYRRRAAPARAAWTRTVELDPGTRLGRTARALLGSIETGGSGRNP